MQEPEQIRVLAEEFAACRKALQALGDENRQHLILEMLRLGRCSGVRVGEIQARSNLSRPAVSHHLRILRDAGLVKLRREGTRNYYYFDADAGTLERLIGMLTHASQLLERLPDRNKEEEHGTL